MKTNLRRIRRGAIVLGCVVAVGVLGFRWIGRGWIDALYMTAMTISTVGFSEHSDLPPGEQIFITALILAGISCAVYTLGGFLTMMAEGEVERAMGVYRSNRAIDRLENHVIICGYGRIGRVLAGELKSQGQRLVVVDSDGERVTLAANEHLAYTGDATEEEVLTACGIQRARALITALPTDAANVFITLTSRNLNPKLRIIARGESSSSQKKLMQAGATRVVLPAVTGAQHMAAMITRPSALEFVELIAGRSVMDVEIDEIVIPERSTLIGRTVADTEARRRHGLLIVAVRREHGNLVFNPDADFKFSAADTVIVMGKPPCIVKFRDEYTAHDRTKN